MVSLGHNLVLLVGSLSTALAQPDPLALPSPPIQLNITVDGEPLTVDNYYRVLYVEDPVFVWDRNIGDVTDNYQRMNIYVPENATEDSPIILGVNNGGWRGGQVRDSVTDGGSYSSITNNTGAALKAGYIVVNAGSRSRQMTADEEGTIFVGHASAVVVDIKAAIRYLRYNDDAMLGSTDRIIVTGGSGGGGLSVALAASGNSPEYYPYLYEIGAAGVTYDAASGTFVSTLNDDLFGTVAYCPITDLDHADAAYEWQYNTTRAQLTAEFDFYSEEQMAASDWLAVNYVPYFNKLGLRDENGKRLNADKLDDAIIRIFVKEIEEAYVEVGPEQMAADIAALKYPDSSWYSIDENGKATFDLEKYLYFVVRNQDLKTPPAFDNLYTELPGRMNESDLAGTTEQEYSNFSEWAWNHNAEPGDGVGWDDTGLPWRGFIQTDTGKAVVKQMKMITPMPYLVSDTEGDSAPYWYYRHGMRDRDTSFAVEVAMYYAALNAYDVRNVNFELTWLKGHGGADDVPEAYEWVAEAVHNANTFDVVDALIGDTVTEGFSGLPTEGVTYSSSNEDVFKAVGGEAVVTPLKNKDVTVTLTVRVVSDEIAGDGYNYAKVDVTRTFTFVVPAEGN